MASPLQPTRKSHSITSQQWRRNALLQDYALMDPAYVQTDEYTAWVERRFKYASNLPVALDATTGLLHPPWAYAAGAQADFAAAFAGFADTPVRGEQYRVSVMTFGGSIEGYLLTPDAFQLHTWFTLEDNPVTGNLHAWFWKPTVTIGEVIARCKSSGLRKRETVELNYISTTLFSTTITGGTMYPEPQ